MSGSDKSILAVESMISPKQVRDGISYGLSSFGYDARRMNLRYIMLILLSLIKEFTSDNFVTKKSSELLNSS